MFILFLRFQSLLGASVPHSKKRKIIEHKAPRLRAKIRANLVRGIMCLPVFEISYILGLELMVKDRLFLGNQVHVLNKY